MKRLTSTQSQIYHFIRKRIAEGGIPPTVREICKATGLRSTSTVHYHLRTLEEYGYISRDKKLNRSIRLSGDSTTMVPLLERIATGAPALTIEHIEDYIPFSASKASSSDLFALRIDDESMLGAGILDGDIAVFEKDDSPQSGDIVVALINNKAIIKRYFCECNQFRLQSENPNFAPIIVTDLRVLGRVIATIRYY